MNGIATVNSLQTSPVMWCTSFTKPLSSMAAPCGTSHRGVKLWCLPKFNCWSSWSSWSSWSLRFSIADNYCRCCRCCRCMLRKYPKYPSWPSEWGTARDPNTLAASEGSLLHPQCPLCSTCDPERRNIVRSCFIMPSLYIIYIFIYLYLYIYTHSSIRFSHIASASNMGECLAVSRQAAVDVQAFVPCAKQRLAKTSNTPSEKETKENETLHQSDGT